MSSLTVCWTDNLSCFTIETWCCDIWARCSVTLSLVFLFAQIVEMTIFCSYTNDLAIWEWQCRVFKNVSLSNFPQRNGIIAGLFTLWYRRFKNTVAAGLFFFFLEVLTIPEWGKRAESNADEQVIDRCGVGDTCRHQQARVDIPVWDTPTTNSPGSCSSTSCIYCNLPQHVFYRARSIVTGFPG